MNNLLAKQLPPNTHLAWTFSQVLEGTFQRNRPELRHRHWPIIGPLPQRASMDTLEGKGLKGPFIYFVADEHRAIKYVGKSKEATVLKRWIRPDLNGTPRWTHGTTTVAGTATIEHIARGLKAGQRHFSLHFVSIDQIRRGLLDRAQRLTPNSSIAELPHDFELIEAVEAALIREIRPEWNSSVPAAPSNSILSILALWWIDINEEAPAQSVATGDHADSCGDGHEASPVEPTIADEPNNQLPPHIAYFNQQLQLSDKSQTQISSEAGFAKPNIISMIKSGRVSVPFDRIPALSKALGCDQKTFMWLALNDREPNFLKALIETFGITGPDVVPNQATG